MALAVLATAGLAFADTDPSFPDISQKDVQAAIHSHKAVLLDCNGSKSYHKGHIPGAIDFQANKDRLAKLLPSNKSEMIITYCGGPACHAYRNGAKEAAALGYLNIRHFSGGISGWESSKLPVSQ